MHYLPSIGLSSSVAKPPVPGPGLRVRFQSLHHVTAFTGQSTVDKNEWQLYCIAVAANLKHLAARPYRHTIRILFSRPFPSFNRVLFNCITVASRIGLARQTDRGLSFQRYG